jgi:hypothetical protein
VELVPSRNICGDVGHRQILGNVGEEQVEALVSCTRGVHMGTTCPNLRMKLHKKTKMQEKNKPKEIKLRIDKDQVNKPWQ